MHTFLGAKHLFCFFPTEPLFSLSRLEGHAWTTDFGCSDKPEQFEWLIKYSPLHNVKHREDVQYPATLVRPTAACLFVADAACFNPHPNLLTALQLTTGDHDDRVVPLHSLKFIATLQHELGSAANQTNPIIIRVETKAGHGAGKPTEKQVRARVQRVL